MTHSLSFAVDPVLWLPVPRRSDHTEELRSRWLAAATRRAARNAAAERRDLEEITLRCATVLDSADESERCVFFPLGEVTPIVATFAVTDATDAWFEWLDEAAVNAGRDARVAREARPHPALDGAVRIMRLERPAAGAARVTVIFAGHRDGRAVTLSAVSEGLSAMGQFARAGAVLFDSFVLKESVVA